MSTIENIIETLETKLGAIDAFDKKIKLILDDEIIIIDGHTQPPSLAQTADEVDITATTTIEVFSQILAREINVQMAMMTGKIKTEGNMVAAVPLMKLL
mgnify:CR=1 FL=1